MNSSFNHFLFEQTRWTNLIGLIAALAILIVYQHFDEVLLENSVAIASTQVRFGLLTPLLLLSIYFCWTNERHLFELYVSTFIVGLTIWVNGLFLVSGENIYALLLSSVLISLFAHLVINLATITHLLLICLQLVGVIFVLHSEYLSSSEAFIIYAISLILTLVISIYLIASRQSRYDQLYRALQQSKRGLESRYAWNSLLKDAVNQLRSGPFQEVKKDLERLENENPHNRFMRRAADSAKELDILVDRLMTQTDWTDSNARAAKSNYSLQSHLKGVVGELQLKHAPININLEAKTEILTSVDKALVTRLVANLVDNACRFAPTGTPVTISISGGHTIHISNEGPHFTQPFERLATPHMKGERPGQYGIGLFICQRICAANNIGMSGVNTERGVQISLRFNDDINDLKQAEG